MLKTKKAISPILATLLLIVIAVAAIVVTYAWIMTYMSNAQQQAGVMLWKVNVVFYDNGTIGIDTGNSGDASTQIIQVYVGNTSTTVQSQATTPPLPIVLAPKSIATVTVNYTWTAGATYYFKIVCSTGQALEYPEQAPL
jgi:flagellin-like protein